MREVGVQIGNSGYNLVASQWGPTMWTRIIRAAAAALVLSMFSLSLAAQRRAFASDGTAQLAYPANGPVIGQGVDLSTGLGSANVCITGATRQGTPEHPLPQVTAVFVHSATDASTYFHQAGLSASAQVKALIGSADVSVSYITSEHFLRSSSLVSVVGRTEQRQYVTPAGAALRDSDPTPDLNVSRAIALTEHARNLARTDISTFRSECGDGFIAVLAEGAVLTGTIEIEDQNTEVSSNTAASLNGTYGVAAFSAKMTDVMSQTSRSSRFSFNYVESGGSGMAVATDQTGLINALSHLAVTAVSSPFPLYVIVRDYSSLPNWPQNIAPPHLTADTLSQLMELYWQVDALFAQATDAKQSLATPEQQRYLVGFNFTPASLNQLLDDIKDMRTKLSSQAVECYNKHPCETPHLSPRDIYALAVKLPLPWPPQTPAARSFSDEITAMKQFAYEFNSKKLIRVFNVRGIHDPTCYQQNHIVTQQFEAEGFPRNIQNGLDQFRPFMSALPPRLRDDAVAYYGRDVALRRCVDSPADADCALTAADFDAMGAAIPLSGLSLQTNFYPTIDEFGRCPGDTNTTPYLRIGVQ
jgi:hypothetical protein